MWPEFSVLIWLENNRPLVFFCHSSKWHHFFKSVIILVHKAQYVYYMYIQTICFYCLLSALLNRSNTLASKKHQPPIHTSFQAPNTHQPSQASKTHQPLRHTSLRDTLASEAHQPPRHTSLQYTLASETHQPPRHTSLQDTVASKTHQPPRIPLQCEFNIFLLYISFMATYFLVTRT